ncbi:hypothetical protein BDF20DRAFT_846611 [Mycotypha africana]|uniref:uncharacterized protein n=1 Tax=Mycotypha africana TaxID=64632 RepID=UPI002300837E|nr:uncharacterized protein BDF20DRAFT_846611 [Mycotypha africana]KAI8991807.1 hypothetical protein BDF20DRAFT_846611 [Mycotypha africana]
MHESLTFFYLLFLIAFHYFPIYHTLRKSFMNNKYDLINTTTANEKDDNRRKSVRKRDKFWKLLFSNQQLQPLKKQHHKKRSSMGNSNGSFFFTSRSNNSKNNSTIKRTQEQLNKINTIAKYAQHNISVSLDPEIFEYILESNAWDTKKSLADLIDYEEASHGILVEPPFASTSATPSSLLGSENDGGTSCYIDALLFAMYISNTTFDPLLTYDIPSNVPSTPGNVSDNNKNYKGEKELGDFGEKTVTETNGIQNESNNDTDADADDEEDDYELNEESEKKIKLQTLMRLFVNKLRKGHFVNADYVHWFRKVLEEAKWNGRDENGQWTQEDASELFLFITEIFDLPYLPVSSMQQQ